ASPACSTSSDRTTLTTSWAAGASCASPSARPAAGGRACTPPSSISWIRRRSASLTAAKLRCAAICSERGARLFRVPPFRKAQDVLLEGPPAGGRLVELEQAPGLEVMGVVGVARRVRGGIVRERAAQVLREARQLGAHE